MQPQDGTQVGQQGAAAGGQTQYGMQPQADEAADSQHLPESDLFFAHRGEFEVAVSDGPSDMSQRDEVAGFVDTLLQTLPALGLPGQMMQQIIAIAIRLKNIGTYGDEIADLLAPPQAQNIPPQARAMVMQAQAQLQEAMAELQQLKLEKAGQAMQYQGKMALADKQQETEMLVAEITTKAQNINERMSAFDDMMAQWHQQAHDLAMQGQQQQAAAQQQQAAQAGQPPAQAQGGQQPVGPQQTPQPGQ